MEQSKQLTYEELLNSGKTIPSKPMQNRVIVLPDPAEDKTQGGIYIPDTAKKITNVGTVVSAGPGTKEYEMICQPGDRVLYGQVTGKDFEHEGVTYLLLSAVLDVISVL